MSASFKLLSCNSRISKRLNKGNAKTSHFLCEQNIRFGNRASYCPIHQADPLMAPCPHMRCPHGATALTACSHAQVPASAPDVVVMNVPLAKLPVVLRLTDAFNDGASLVRPVWSKGETVKVCSPAQVTTDTSALTRCGTNRPSWPRKA